MTHEDEYDATSPAERARDDAAAAELTAAMIDAFPGGGEPLPPHLAAKIVASGEAMVRAQATRPVAPRPVAPVSVASAPTATWRMWGGWLAAAAAMVLWAVGPRSPGRSTEVAVAPSVALLRSELLVRDSTTQRIAWTATTDASSRGASGDVVWNGQAQAGVMRFVGLQANDRGRWQYQLWIFDKARDQRYPVDGGVFDVPPGGGEVLVPITAKVRVGEAVLFAVTVERAGGVVVSGRERIAMLAERKG